MALDGILINKIVSNINKNLPIHINKISAASNTEICFNVLSNNKRTNIIISMHPEDYHIRLSNRNYSDFKEPTTFIMVLRKHLTNGIITSIEQYNYDRYIHIIIKSLDELYDEKKYILVVELMGKYSNILLVDTSTNKIIDAYKKVAPSESAKRIILQGVNYTPIENQNKQNPFNNPIINEEESYVMQLQGFSKQLEKEVRYRLNNNSFNNIMETIKESNKIYISKNKPNIFHIIPMLSEDKEYEEHELLNGLDEVYYQKNETEKIKTITSDIYKVVNKQLKHNINKINKLKKSLEEAKNPEQEREYGNLLFMYDNLNQKGLNEITIKDYDSKETTIKLDPKISIKDNANKYFQTYNKKRKSISYLNEQIGIVQNAIDYLNKINEELIIANHIDAIQIKDDLIQNGYLKARSIKDKRNKKINLYQIKKDNYTITFGKNSIQNNLLTFSYAKKEDTFFHAKDYHGSHVIVSGELNENIIREAANIAAYYSKGRLSSSVPVDYCKIKDVKKIKGSKLGFVSIRNNKTIYIDPIKIDESILINI